MTYYKPSSSEGAPVASIIDVGSMVLSGAELVLLVVMVGMGGV
jgi:hypothetical protein